jgi:hypothetical protein
MKRSTRIALAVVALLWGVSWIFARDIVRGLEELGVLPRRGIVFSDASDFAFSLVVLALLLTLFGLWKLLAVLGKPAIVPVAERDEDPRFRELLRQKELLLRELKELEFDRDLRKISAEDHVAIDRRLRRQATALLRTLDEVDPVRLYGERIREDLQRYLEQGTIDGLVPARTEAEEAWRRQVLDRPLYRELAPVLGKRDLLLAAMRDHWIEAADIDRDALARSVLTVVDRGRNERFTCTLAELRARMLERLADGDERETLRLADIAGLSVEAAEPSVIRYESGGTQVECPPAEFRGRVLSVLSRELAA